MNSITYHIEPNLSSQEFIDVLKASTLAERRPIDNPDRISKMLKNSNLIVTARDNGLLVGVARALTDFTFCTYLSDLAVSEQYQGLGIGKELIKRTKLEAPEALLILLAAPKAINYYPKIGMPRHENCFILNNIDEII